MQFCAVLLLLAGFASAKSVYDAFDVNTAYGYHTKVGIPEAEKIRKAEENLKNKIVGGAPATAGEFPFAAGLLGELVGLNAISVCGGALISADRVATAAHCWNDGIHQAWRLTVVLGSTTLFSGGTRVMSSKVVTHPNWGAAIFRNDVAVVYLPTPVTISSTIAPIAMPDIFDAFYQEQAVAIGYGTTADGVGITTAQTLHHVTTTVISNSECGVSFPHILFTSSLCTSGVGSVGTCSGDSGGPLVIYRDDEPVLIAISQLQSAAGCQAGLPSVFTRVNHFFTFFQEHL